MMSMGVGCQGTHLSSIATNIKNGTKPLLRQKTCCLFIIAKFSSAYAREKFIARDVRDRLSHRYTEHCSLFSKSFSLI